MFFHLFRAKLSRSITTWVFTSLVVIEIIILIPSYLRREGELLAKLENISNEIFAPLMYTHQSEVEARERLRITGEKLRPGSAILGATLYRADGKLIGKFGEQSNLTYAQLGNAKVKRLLSQNNTRYDVAWLIANEKEKYFLVVRHDSAFIQGELLAYSVRILGLVLIVSVFVTFTTMLTVGVTVIRPILQLRDDLIAAGEAISKDADDPPFSTLSFRRKDEMGEVILAFSQMFQRVVKEIRDRKLAEACLRDEQEKSERLLLNILPAEIAQQLKEEQSAIANRFDEVTILFADIVNFTGLAAQISPIELVNSLNQIFSSFDRLAEIYGLEKIKTIGDAYMVVGGLPTPRPNHAIAVAQMALDMQQEITKFPTVTGETFQLRIGINTGSVVAGVIGLKKFSYDLWGDAVNLASRMESHGIVGKIQVSETTYLRIKDQFQLEKRGEIQVKNRGEVTTYFLLGKYVDYAINT
ncbi:MAG TPA: adenylate/guanylate cyclase domain-containing protein [Nostocaceae cyanobacterium]|nr:adenylate/guanylate cyclase domain-containing protein [Nostocaceae cyanobacterium]